MKLNIKYWDNRLSEEIRGVRFISVYLGHDGKAIPELVIHFHTQLGEKVEPQQNIPLVAIDNFYIRD